MSYVASIACNGPQGLWGGQDHARVLGENPIPDILVSFVLAEQSAITPTSSLALNGFGQAKERTSPARVLCVMKRRSEAWGLPEDSRI
jgi:hypothetical protein